MLRFLLLIFVAEMLAFLGRAFVYTEEMLYQTLGTTLTEQQLQKMIVTIEQWGWVGYVMLPAQHFISIVSSLFCLMVGFTISGRDISVKNLFRVCVSAEFITLLPITVILICFFVNPSIALNELSQISSPSLYNIFEPGDVASWLRYPLRKLGVIELLYVIALTVGTRNLWANERMQPTKIVLTSYASGMAIWILFVMYLQVTFS
jgi:hypothetical protein